MSLNYAAVSAALYAHIATDSAGAAVRALLGAGATSVIPARLLPGEAAYPGTLPARPLVAWRRGPIGGQQGDMRTFTAAWWVYDDVTRGDARLDGIVAALEAAHRAQIGIVAFGRVRIGPAGQAAEDRALNLYGQAVQVTYRAL